MPKKLFSHPLFLVCCVLIWSATTANTCTVCRNGEAIGTPEKELGIEIPDFPSLNTCEEVNQLIGFLHEESENCNIVRNISTLCGCPKPEGACDLCADGSGVLDPLKEVPILFQDLFLGITPSCGVIEAFLHNEPSDSATCSLARQILSTYCGCQDAPKQENTGQCQLCLGENATLPDRPIGIEGFPVQTCQELADAVPVFLETGSEMCDLLQSARSFCGCTAPLAARSSCTLCSNGEPATDANVTIPELESLFGFAPTCGLVEAFLMGVDEASEECLSSRAFSGRCGCAPVDNHCLLCDSWENATLEKKLPIARDRLEEINFVPTCGDLQILQYQLSENHPFCELGRSYNWICGCDGGEFDYLGATSTRQKAALAWAPRATGLLSLCGSILILWDILSFRKTKLKTTYSQLLLPICMFDICSSIAWGLSTLMIPEFDEYGEPTRVYGALGNEATCTAQGFFIQLGFTAMFYSTSLSMYYYLVIARGWKESALKPKRIFFHGVPLLLGFSFAFAGIPLYKTTPLVCLVPPPPLEPDRIKSIMFTLVPIFLVISFTTVTMTLIYLKVRKDLRKSNKWRRDGNKKKKSKKRNLESEVFWQCVFYLLAFWLSWPIQASFYSETTTHKSYPHALMVALFAPLQGFSNAVVYFRPKVQKYLRERQRLRNARPKVDTQTSDGEGELNDTSSNSRMGRWIGSFGRKLQNKRDNMQRDKNAMRIAVDPSEELVMPEDLLADDQGVFDGTEERRQQITDQRNALSSNGINLQNGKSETKIRVDPSLEFVAPEDLLADDQGVFDWTEDRLQHIADHRHSFSANGVGLAEGTGAVVRSLRRSTMPPLRRPGQPKSENSIGMSIAPAMVPGGEMDDSIERDSPLDWSERLATSSAQERLASIDEMNSNRGEPSGYNEE